MQKLFTLLLAFILFENIQAQTLILNESPENYQLYARDSENKAVVSINGKIVEGDINVKISEGDEKWKRIELKCFRDGEVIESKEMAPMTTDFRVFRAVTVATMEVSLHWLRRLLVECY